MRGDAILDTIEGEGIALTLEEKGIRWSGGRLSDQMKLLIRDNKDAVIEVLRERERLASLPKVEVETPPQEHDSAWTTRQLNNLYKAIGDGAVLGLNWEVKGVAEVHRETAKKAIETLLDVGAPATMAALVAVYKEQMERLKAGGKDTFPLKAALACAAVHPKPKVYPAWYQELLDAWDNKEIKAEVAEGDFSEEVIDEADAA